MNSRRFWPRLALVALTLLPLTLTGCLRYAVDGEIRRDNTISGSFIFALKSELVDRLFGGEAPYLAELKKQLNAEPMKRKLLVPMKPNRGRVNLEVYRSGDLVGYRQHFDRVPFAELDPERVVIDRNQRRFIVDVDADLIGFADLNLGVAPGGESSPAATPSPGGGPRVRIGDELADRGAADGGTEGPDAGVVDADDVVAGQLRSKGIDPDTVIGDQAPQLSLRLSFPGEVISTNGDVDGRSVSWRLSLDDTRTLHVSAWDFPPKRSWTTELFLTICGLGGLGLLFQVLRFRRRRRSMHGRGTAGFSSEPAPLPLGFAGLPSLGGDDDAASTPRRVGE
ncbi:MAG: LppM family (lipo)protein [Mycobacteriales bacterium]